MKPRQKKSLMWLYYALLTLLCSLLETAVFSRLPIFGVRIVLIPSLVALVGACRGADEGGAFGLLAGLFWAFSGVGSPAVILLLTAAGCFGGYLCDALLTRRLLSALIASAIALLGTLVLAAMLHAYLHGGSGRVIFAAILQAIFSLPAAAALYFPVQAIGKVGG